jgi:Tfp pilus assembly protein PilF
LVSEALSKPRDAEQFYRQAIDAGETRARVDYGLFLFKSGRSVESVAMLAKAGAGP